MLLAASSTPPCARALRDLGCYFMTEFQQKQLKQEQIFNLVNTSIFLLHSSLKLAPADRVCRENLANLLLATRRDLPAARSLALGLAQEFPQEPRFLEIAALCFYTEGNLKAALDLFGRADKLRPVSDVDTLLRIMKLLVDLYEKEGYLDTANSLYILNKQLNTFRALRAAGAMSADRWAVFAQNFLYQVHEPLTKLFNYLVSYAKDGKGQHGGA